MATFDEDISDGFQSALEGFCLELLHQGYESMLAAKGYDVDWKEDKLTVHYIAHMKTLKLQKEHKISITPQFIIYSDEHAFGEEEVEKAPRIDFKFSQWTREEEIDYFAEAKNLCEKGWRKKDGTYVSSSYYNNRYIKTGIHHLVTPYYPSNCVLIAYVLNGHKNAVLAKLNSLISSDFTDYGTITKPITPSNDEYYISENLVGDKSIMIKHLFLQLHTQEHRRNDEIVRILRTQEKNLGKASYEQKQRIAEQITLLEYVKNEKFQGQAGILRVNLAWNTTDDLDLHIETEEGEINHSNKIVGFGKLDIDANFNEPFTNQPQENIVFTQFPKGRCRAKIKFYAQREKVEVDFILSILTVDDEIKVYLKTVNFENQKMIEVAEFEFKDGVLLIQNL
jgi:hypothetical protein